jgi:hypothetical protein
MFFIIYKLYLDGKIHEFSHSGQCDFGVKLGHDSDIL